jgi:glycosyltransferase involved in cell wall biosynthesis
MARKIALIPVYNEESTLVSVLDELCPEVDQIVLVDDGSSDRSPALAQEWVNRHPDAVLLRMPENCGMSLALREGFVHLAERLSRGELDPDDLLLTLDADGQHDAREIGALCEFVQRGGHDVALTRRDFGLYPLYKRLGNAFMTFWSRIWSGFHYHDVESGFRAMRLKVLPALLDYYTGYKYSCAQEIAVLTARLGFRINNDFRTVIRLYRSQTRLRDVVVNAAVGFWAFGRWALRSKVAPREALSRAVIHSEPL